MKNVSIFLGFAPWIIFDVVSGPSTWMWAALAAFLSSLIISVPAYLRTRELNVLDVAGVLFFAVLVVLALVLNRSDLQILEDRAQTLSSVVLAVIAFGGLAVGKPFTEYYARQSTPREYWGNPTFRHINRVLTAVWGLTFVISALCDAAVAAGASPDVFNWVVPIVVIIAAVKFTGWYPDHVSPPGDDAEPAGASPSAPGSATTPSG